MKVATRFMAYIGLTFCFLMLAGIVIAVGTNRVNEITTNGSAEVLIVNATGGQVIFETSINSTSWIASSGDVNGTRVCDGARCLVDIASAPTIAAANITSGTISNDRLDMTTIVNVSRCASAGQVIVYDGAGGIYCAYNTTFGSSGLTGEIMNTTLWHFNGVNQITNNQSIAPIVNISGNLTLSETMTIGDNLLVRRGGSDPNSTSYYLTKNGLVAGHEFHTLGNGAGTGGGLAVLADELSSNPNGYIFKVSYQLGAYTLFGINSPERADNDGGNPHSAFYFYIKNASVGNVIQESLNAKMEIKTRSAGGGPSGDIILNPASTYVLPAASNTYTFGSSSYKWKDIYVVNAVHVGDIVFEYNGWRMIEAEKLTNNKSKGMFMLNGNGEAIAWLTESGDLKVKGSVSGGWEGIDKITFMDSGGIKKNDEIIRYPQTGPDFELPRKYENTTFKEYAGDTYISRVPSKPLLEKVELPELGYPGSPNYP